MHIIRRDLIRRDLPMTIRQSHAIKSPTDGSQSGQGLPALAHADMPPTIGQVIRIAKASRPSLAKRPGGGQVSSVPEVGQMV